MEEVGDFLSLVGRDNLSSLISLRELSTIGLDPQDLLKHRSLISHVQMENPTEEGGLRHPPLPDDGIDYRIYLRGLRNAGYEGVIALPEAAGKTSLDFCRSLWNDLD